MAFVMAGGEGSRLRPLTLDRCKPGVPFGSRYRIVDFVLSSLVNSDIRSIYLSAGAVQAAVPHQARAQLVGARFAMDNASCRLLEPLASRTLQRPNPPAKPCRCR